MYDESFAQDSKSPIRSQIFFIVTLFQLIVWCFLCISMIHPKNDLKQCKIISVCCSSWSYNGSCFEGVGIQCLLEELGIPIIPVVLVMCESQGAIALVQNPVFHRRTKHIDVKYLFIWDGQQEKKINLAYISTDELQLAHILTKPLSYLMFETLHTGLGVIQLQTWKREYVSK